MCFENLPKKGNPFIKRQPYAKLKIYDIIIFNLSIWELKYESNLSNKRIINRCRSDKFDNYNFYTCPTTIEITQEIEEESRVESSDSKR